MEYRKLGKSDLEISAITFGSWAAGGWQWGSTDRQDAVNAIRASYDLGVTSIDTAPIYGQGTSEEIVGEAIRGIPRDKVQILTKFGLRWDTDKGIFRENNIDVHGKPFALHKYAGKDGVIFECEESLKRLGTDYIDLYQIHWPDESTPIDETFEAVERLIEQGKVRYAGVCNYSAQEMEEAEQTLNIVSNQVPFSMVNRGIEEETLPYCVVQGKGILAYSPLERGLLTGKIHAGYTFEEGDHRSTHPSFQPDFIKRTNDLLRKLKPIADEHSATLSQLVLRWTIERAGITVALAGARNAHQAIQNAEVINVKLSADELDYINKVVAEF